MKTKFWIFLMLAAVPLHAQQNVQFVRLSDCIDQALGKNPSIQISQAKVAAAEARASEVTTALLPQLKFTARAIKLSEVEPFVFRIDTTIGFYSVHIAKEISPALTENYGMRLSLQQPLFTGLKLLKSREMANLNTDAVREDLSRDQLEMVLQITTAYWNLYRAQKIEEVIGQSVEQVAEHVKDVTNLLKQGLATDADVMKVRVQYSDIKVKHIEAKNSIRLAAMALNSILGNPLETAVMPSDTPTISPGMNIPVLHEELLALQGRARNQRPELKSMQLRCEMSTAGITAAKSGWYPQIFLAANYDYARPNQRIFPVQDRWDGTWDVGVTLQWNIWDWLATHQQTIQAQAALRQAEAGIVQLNDAVALDVAQQYYNAQTAKEKVEVTFEGMEQAQESYRMTSEKFKNGMTSNTDLLDAEMALLQAKLTHTQSIVDCTLALARLKKAVGENK
jgi:outer membrane protein